MNPGWYEIYKSWGKWRWRYKAGNGEIIASGQGYFDKEDCKYAIRIMSNTNLAEIRELP